MAIKLMTAYTDADINASDDAEVYKSIIGSGNYVFSAGSELAITVNPGIATITIADGAFAFSGRVGRVINSISAAYTPPAAVDRYRKIIAVLRYQKNTATLKESISLQLLQGNELSSAAAAQVSEVEINASVICGNATVADFPLYTVIVSADEYSNLSTEFNKIKPLSELADDAEVLSESLSSETFARESEISAEAAARDEAIVTAVTELKTLTPVLNSITSASGSSFNVNIGTSWQSIKVYIFDDEYYSYCYSTIVDRAFLTSMGSSVPRMTILLGRNEAGAHLRLTAYLNSGIMYIENCTVYKDGLATTGKIKIYTSNI